MRGFFNGLVLGIILGAAGYWFVETKAREHPEAQQRYEDAVAQANTNAGEAALHFSDAFKAKIETLDLRGDEIKDEMARTGKVVRRKAVDIGDKLADAAADARIVTVIKAKYAADHDLSVWKISVSSDQGHVALSGEVNAPDDVGKAVALALEADGVRDVTSTLTIKPSN
jgi:BON domain